MAAEVLIIGAGAAGLAAARSLRKAGVAFILLEASDRIGGRARTVNAPFGQPFDWGCAWMHAADRNPFFAEAVNHGFTPQYHDPNLDRVYFGPRRASATEMARIFMADFDLATRLGGHAESAACLASLLGPSRYSTVTATYGGPMDFAQDADEVSIADVKGSADLDPNFLVREGFGAVVAQWGGGVPVELATPVTTLRWGGTGVVAETPRGDIAARAAIVTVSTGVMAFGALRFAPDLPDAHARAIHDLPMGLLTKIPLQIVGDRHGLLSFEDMLVENHGSHDIYFHCLPFGGDLLVGFVGGDFAWELAAAGEAAAVDFAIGSLVGVFGGNIAGQVVASAMTDWHSNRWTRGAYAAARPGCHGARQTLLQPVGDRIYFAGEALGGPLMQTCAGARLSGEAAAHKVARALNPKVP